MCRRMFWSGQHSAPWLRHNRKVCKLQRECRVHAAAPPGATVSPEKRIWAKPYHLKVNLTEETMDERDGIQGFARAEHWLLGHPAPSPSCSPPLPCVFKKTEMADGVRAIFISTLALISRIPAKAKCQWEQFSFQFKQTCLYFNKISQLTASYSLALIWSSMFVSFPNHQSKIKI